VLCWPERVDSVKIEVHPIYKKPQWLLSKMKNKFIDEVELACNVALSSYDFHFPRRGTRLISISTDIYGWVGLNRSKTGNTWRINPFVGLHCVSIMRLWYELASHRKLKYLRGQTATASLHLGELAPNVDGFSFEQSQPPESEARRLAEAIIEFGVPWMRENANLEALLSLFRRKEEMLGGYPERIAVVLFLLGRFNEVSDYLDSRLHMYAQKPTWGEVQESWQQFSTALRNRLPHR
jgi:hypothetical protein